MKKYLKSNWPFIVLAIIVFATRFWNLGIPSEVVFDEVHFGKFISAYFSHKYYFDIHPPLGKLMIAGFSKVAGLEPNFDFNLIGETYDYRSLFILRFLPTLFGSLFVLLLYKLILVLGCSKKAAFFGAALVLLDNAFLVESKFILVDSFLFFFGFASLYFYFLSKKASGTGQIILLIIASVFTGLSISIKWTGLTFFAIISFSILIDFFKNPKIKPLLLKVLLFLIVPFLIYVSFFIVHFSLLYKSGPGDAFMSPAFQKELQGSTAYTTAKPLSFWRKFVELNKAMYTGSSTLTATHPDGSQWFEWPFMRKPIWYWVKNIPDKAANIYLFGNPAVWWSTGFLMIWLALSLLIGKPLIFGRMKKIPFDFYLLLLGYFINLLAFIFIGRVTFLYHYLISLTFAILIFAYLVDREFSDAPILEEKPYKIKKLMEKGKLEIEKGFFGFRSLSYFAAYSGFLLATLACFVFVAPISYGLPISQKLNSVYQVLIKILH